MGTRVVKVSPKLVIDALLTRGNQIKLKLGDGTYYVAECEEGLPEEARLVDIQVERTLVGEPVMLGFEFEFPDLEGHSELTVIFQQVVDFESIYNVEIYTKARVKEAE